MRKVPLSWLIIAIVLLGLIIWQLGSWISLSGQPETLARVNGVEITSDMVAHEISLKRLDPSGMLPALTDEAATNLKAETVEALVTRQLILQAAEADGFELDEAEIEQRVQQILRGYGAQGLPTGARTIDEQAFTQQVQQALARADLKEADLRQWVRAVYTVEAYLDQVVADEVTSYAVRQQQVDRWLKQARQQAVIELYP